MLKLHEKPFPVEIIDGHAIVPNAELFLSTKFTASLHVFAMYARAEVYQHQFEGMDWVSTQSPALLSLVGPARICQGGSRVPLAILPDQVAPSGLQNMFSSLPVLTITTLSTAMEDECQECLQALDRSFVVVDQPLGHHLEHWAAAGWKASFAVTALDLDRSLNLVTIVVDHLPQHLFVAFRSEAGIGELIENHRNYLRPDLEIDDVLGAQIHAVAAQLRNSWWIVNAS